ncbi:hypothetical protein DQ04_05691060 [Trypanosoma grayi]|uniref:hypothetical protein n=1 Tax=Trypanosoma grayi TaxID=71804 RepID=UPI0004F46C38|nr:hypothetical protein DQ04_05691060 [Trypanosoma grayi]KEG09170.1 hypothetical protein DQ04_05691060 [Trypanosoma grayi]
MKSLRLRTAVMRQGVLGLSGALHQPKERHTPTSYSAVGVPSRHRRQQGGRHRGQRRSAVGQEETTHSHPNRHTLRRKALDAQPQRTVQPSRVSPSQSVAASSKQRYPTQPTTAVPIRGRRQGTDARISTTATKERNTQSRSSHCPQHVRGAQLGHRCCRSSAAQPHTRHRRTDHTAHSTHAHHTAQHHRQHKCGPHRHSTAAQGPHECPSATAAVHKGTPCTHSTVRHSGTLQGSSRPAQTPQLHCVLSRRGSHPISHTTATVATTTTTTTITPPEPTVYSRREEAHTTPAGTYAHDAPLWERPAATQAQQRNPRRIASLTENNQTTGHSTNGPLE